MPASHRRAESSGIARRRLLAGSVLLQVAAAGAFPGLAAPEYVPQTTIALSPAASNTTGIFTGYGLGDV